MTALSGFGRKCGWFVWCVWVFVLGGGGRESGDSVVVLGKEWGQCR